MGLLDHLWDDTLAGPRPDTGLGKLRKHATFSVRSDSGKEILSSISRSYGGEAAEDAAKVTRSIMMVKPPVSDQKESPPVSPASGTPPISPFSGSGKEAFWFRKRSTSFAFEKSSGVGPRSPPPLYDL
ncbi:dormancy-associated protein homolog 3-like [Andrographis paniculata]|uniref:dormancy-associated protein homolog 3-like n=1 Tax=Andrographis paniculata TaxID=175694 RepID=UPI0021E8D28F|nr:dormancy-associated protein homolog 3-like [Andrographis paniculata]